MSESTQQESFRIGFVVRLKQGDILKAMRDRGWTQKQTAEFLGMHHVYFGKLLNLKYVPQEFSPEIARGLMELTGKNPEDLFPRFMRRKEFLEAEKVREFYRDLTPEALLDAGLQRALPGPDEIFEDIERDAFVRKALTALTPREAEVLRKIFSEGQTGDEVGAELGISGKRIGQIRGKALRKLKRSFREMGIEYSAQELAVAFKRVWEEK